MNHRQRHEQVLERVRQVKQLIRQGHNTNQALQKVGISSCVYYTNRHEVPDSEINRRDVADNNTPEPERPRSSPSLAFLKAEELTKEVTKLRALCNAQATLLKAYGLRLELTNDKEGNNNEQS